MTRPTSIGATLLSLVACAGALILPGPAAEQWPLRGSHGPVHAPAPGDGSFRPPSPQSSDPHADFRTSFYGSQLRETVDGDGIRDEVAKVLVDEGGLADIQDGGHHHHDGGHPGDTEKYTIYQLISRSKYTTKFAKIVDQHPDIVDLLNCTEASYTLFVPTDSAFEDIPDHHEDVPKEFVENLLRYHVGAGKYPAEKILSAYTLPTELHEEQLGDEPQRLRVSFGFRGVKINVYSKIVATDIFASNGVIHGLDHILIPPPYIGTILNLFPSRFSTLLLAYDRTDFVKFIHGTHPKGTTVFAPTNAAFAYLGVETNAFLFNTMEGKKYLKALLKYQIVPDVTLYTDAIYDKREEKHDAAQMGWETQHYDLPTYLCDARIGVDIARVFGFVTIKVNGFTQVILANAVGKNGVLQVVDRVPLPPYKHKEVPAEEMFGSVDVEDLKMRLEPYLD